MHEVLRVENLMQTSENGAFLNKLHFVLMKGEILGIIGLHDSGRSTLVNILSGRLPASSGNIYIDGKIEELHTIQQAQNKGIFCIREETALFPDLSLIENMCLISPGISNSFFFPGREMRNDVKFLLEALQLGFDLKDSCKSLSLSDQHRLEIIRAYLNGAKVVILHDIMQSYNEREERELLELLRWLKMHEIGIIITGSRPEQMTFVCDRIVVTRAGRDVGLFFKEEFSVDKIERTLIGPKSSSEMAETSLQHGEPLLSAKNISNSKLKDFSFEIFAGEIVGFVDKHNAVARCIADLFNGIDPHTSGSIVVNEKEFIAGTKVVLDQSCRGGYVSDYKKCIFPGLSLEENLAIASLPLFSRGPFLSKNLEKVAVSEFIKEYGIDEKDLKQKISHFSSFFQMKICYYRWLLANVRVLVLDDVFLGTDVLMRNSLNEFFSLAKKKKMAIVIVSSNYSALKEVCTRIEYL